MAAGELMLPPSNRALVEALERGDQKAYEAFFLDNCDWAIRYAQDNGAGELADEIAKDAMFLLCIKPRTMALIPVRVALSLKISEMIEGERASGTLVPQKARRNSWARRGAVWVLDRLMDAVDPRTYGPRPVSPMDS